MVRQALDERAIYLRNLKVDVLPDLPDRSFTRLTVPLAPVQAQLYDAALGRLIEEIEALDDKQFLKQLGTYLARRMALLRITSNPAGVFDHYDELPAKLGALDELVDPARRGRWREAGDLVVLHGLARRDRAALRALRCRPLRRRGDLDRRAP